MALIGLGLAACQPKTAVRAPCPAGKLCLEYGNGADPISLDPQRITATNEAAILRELIEGLYADGPNGEPVLGVADKPPQISPDGLVWTFHLRPEVWSDGVSRSPPTTSSSPTNASSIPRPPRPTPISTTC